MSDKLTAASKIRGFAALFKQCGDIADALDAIGSFEQASLEASNALQGKRDQLTALTAQIEELAAKRSAAHEEAAALTAEAVKEAEAIKVAAQEEAGAIRRSAQEWSDNKIRIAGAYAEEVVQSAEARQASIEGVVLAQQKALEAVNEQVVKARRDLQQLTEEAESVKAKLRALAGG